MLKFFNIIFRIGLVTILIGLSGSFGCQPLDEVPPGILNPETYFETQEDALTALTGAYGGQYGGAQRYYLKSWIIIVDVAGDDMGDGFGGIQPRKEMDRFKYDPAFRDFYNIWWSAYIIINRAGNVIANVPDMPDGAL
jgi:hypothetical protein